MDTLSRPTVTIELDDESAELLRKAVNITNLPPDVVFKEVFRNLRINKFVGNSNYTFESVIHGVVNTKADSLLQTMEQLIVDFHHAKPNDRSDKDRIYAMVISDLQKVIGLFEKYVVRAE